VETTLFPGLRTDLRDKTHQFGAYTGCSLSSSNGTSLFIHRPLTKGRITQQSSPERDEGNAFSKNVFLAFRENKKLGAQTKYELIWCYGALISTTYTVVKSAKFGQLLGNSVFLFLF
jgi:hypothetical protein